MTKEAEYQANLILSCLLGFVSQKSELCADTVDTEHIITHKVGGGGIEWVAFEIKGSSHFDYYTDPAMANAFPPRMWHYFILTPLWMVRERILTAIDCANSAEVEKKSEISLPTVSVGAYKSEPEERSIVLKDSSTKLVVENHPSGPKVWLHLGWREEPIYPAASPPQIHSGWPTSLSLNFAASWVTPFLPKTKADRDP